MNIVFLKIAETMIIFSIIIFGLTTVDAQNEAKVLEISARTSDSVLFQIFADGNVAKGKDILVDYTVSNQGRKNIYLVIDPGSANIKVREISVFEIFPPTPTYDEHLQFNYKFVKIRPQEKYKGKIVLSDKFISSSGLQNLSSAKIRVGFSYLFDISKLGGCKTTTYRLPCLNELNEKSKSLTVGSLLVEIKKP